MHISGKPKKPQRDGTADGSDSMSGSVLSINRQPEQQPKSGQLGGGGGLSAFRGRSPAKQNVDPGVNSDDDDVADEDDFTFDNMSHRSSGSSLNVARSQQHLAIVGGAAANVHPPSPLSTHSTSAATAASMVDSSKKLSQPYDDVKMRSQTLPPPSKPPRVTPEPVAAPAAPAKAVAATLSSSGTKLDEWEAKLYGSKHHLDIGSSADSLKRRSWDSSRVIPLTAGGGGGGGKATPTVTTTPPTPAPMSTSSSFEPGLSSTAPTTPNLEDQKRVVEQLEKPRPLPRSATLESIEERCDDHRSGGGAAGVGSTLAAGGGGAGGDPKSSESKRFLNKFKYFQRNKDRADSAEDLKTAAHNGHQQQQFNERIIIGHENDVGGRRSAAGRRGIGAGGAGNGGGGSDVDGQTDVVYVPPELLKRYDGKTREVSEVVVIGELLYVI